MSLPEITDEDRAVADEAYRLFGVMFSDQCRSVPEVAAALVRTGWKPVDPDLILAREVVGEVNRAEVGDGRYDGYIKDVERGVYDDVLEVKIALAAIKAAEARRKGDG